MKDAPPPGAAPGKPVRCPHCIELVHAAELRFVSAFGLGAGLTRPDQYERDVYNWEQAKQQAGVS